MDKKAEYQAYCDWAFKKEGEAIGRMDGNDAGWAGWEARALLAAGASEGQAEPVAKVTKRGEHWIDKWFVEAIQALPDGTHKLYTHPSAEIAALRERIAGMEKDAERYRFLKARTERLDYDAGWRSCWRIESVDIPTDQPSATLDAAIDAAITKEKPSA